MDYKKYCAVAGLVFVLFISSFPAAAAIMGPIQAAGSISTIYQYSASRDGRSSNYRSLMLNTSFESFFWQPWLISWSGSLRFSLAESGASTQSMGGSLKLHFLPRSRFPLDVAYTRASSVTTSRAETSTKISSERRVDSSSISANQVFTMRSGAMMTAWYSRVNYFSPAVRSEDDDIRGENSSFGGGFSKRVENQSIELSYSEAESTSTGSGQEREKGAISHNYSPAREFSVTSNASIESNRNVTLGESGNETERFIAGSSFFWRPEYSDFSVNGSVQVDESKNGDAVSSGVNAQLAGNHKLSRSVSVSASIAAALNEEEGGARTGSSSQSIGLSYGSDSSLIGRFTWSWNTGLSASNNITRGQNESDRVSLAVSFGHSAGRSMRLSGVSSLNLSLSQSASVSKVMQSSDDDVAEDALAKSLGHAMSIGYNTAIEGGSSSLWTSLSDSRNLTTKTEQQSFRTNFQRSESLSRQSTFKGSLNYGFTRQVDEDGKSQTGDGSSGGVTYSNSRFLGVHRLVFNSNLRLSEVGQADAGTAVSSSWDNNLNYSLGLLSAAFSASFDHVTGVEGYSQYYMFSVTRTF